MSLVRVFISFDFDHDLDLKTMLVGQARHPGTPFEVADHSVKEPFSGDWKAKVRQRIRRIEQVCVICGEWTHAATGVAAEVEIAREERKPYFLLWGRSSKNATRPTTALSTDKIYNWTWENLKALLGGAR